MSYTNNYVNVVRSGRVIGKAVPTTGMRINAIYPTAAWTITNINSNEGLVTITPIGLPIGSGDVILYPHLCNVEESSFIAAGYTAASGDNGNTGSGGNTGGGGGGSGGGGGGSGGGGSRIFPA